MKPIFFIRIYKTYKIFCATYSYAKSVGDHVDPNFAKNTHSATPS